MEDQRVTILIVDDDCDSRLMYGEFLTSQGYSVVLARNGLEGLTRAREARPDLVITDVLLGPSSTDSLELVRRIRSDTQIADTPVLVLTGWTSAAYREHARQLGCAGFLVKPCPPLTLVDEIRRVLSWKLNASKGGL